MTLEMPTDEPPGDQPSATIPLDLVVVELSEAQRRVLIELAEGRRCRAIAPITRRWLQRHGLVKPKPIGSRRDLSDVEITDFGRAILKRSVEVCTGRGRPTSGS